MSVNVEEVAREINNGLARMLTPSNEAMKACRWVKSEVEKVLTDALTQNETWVWQPIETAPKDGTHILVCNIYTFNSQGVATVAHWFNYIGDESKSGWFLTWNKNEEDADCGMKSITHWMPLPAHP